MKFEVISESDFRAFAKTSPYKSFMQTPEIANLREQNGWTPYYLGVENNGRFEAATMLVAILPNQPLNVVILKISH